MKKNNNLYWFIGVFILISPLNLLGDWRLVAIASIEFGFAIYFMFIKIKYRIGYLIFIGLINIIIIFNRNNINNKEEDKSEMQIVKEFSLNHSKNMWESSDFTVKFAEPQIDQLLLSKNDEIDTFTINIDHSTGLFMFDSYETEDLYFVKKIYKDTLYIEVVKIENNQTQKEEIRLVKVK
jgi:hypothetical protein